MIHDPTFGVRAARSRTGIDALVSHAGSVARAIRVDHALRTARLVRIADVLGRTNAFVRAGRFIFAHGVRTARMSFARTIRWSNVRLD